MKSILLITVLICMAIWSLLSSANAQELNYVNSALWSNFNDIKVVDTLAYCVSGSGLTIINVANPEEPRFLSRIFTPGESRKVDVAGNYVYFADNTGALYEHGSGNVYCYDISNPINPQFCSVWADEYNWIQRVNDLDIADTLAFVVWHKPAVVNYANPYHPEMICDGDDYGLANSVFNHENYLYLLSDVDFKIFEISQPSNPVLTSTVPVNNYTTLVNLFVDSGYCYILVESDLPMYHWLWICDISDPYNVEIISETQIRETAYGDIKVAGDYAYISTVSGLQIFDIANPRFPHEVSNTDIVSSIALDIYNDLAYLTMLRYGLMIYDVTNPEFPSSVGNYYGGYNTQDIFVANNLAYVATAMGDLQILEISNPNDITVIGSYIDTFRQALEIEVIGGFAYVGFNYNTLSILDVSNPYNPELTYADSGLTWITDILLLNDFAFISSQNDGVFIFDTSNPGSPVLVNHLLNGILVKSLCLNDTVLFASAFENGVYAYDVSSPYNPNLIATFNVDNYYIRNYSVKVDNDLLFIALGYDGLLIYNIRDLGDPLLIPHSTSIFSEFIEIKDNMLIAAIQHFVSLYDISNPSEPIFLNSIHTPGIINEMTMDDDNLYVGTDASIIIYQLALTGIEQVAEIPANFVLSPNYPNPFNASTTISYSLPQESPVKLDIYNILGRKVQTLYEGNQQAGEHSVTWHADGFVSGVYFYKLTAGEFEESEKMILIK